MSKIDIIPLIGDNEWMYKDWRITRDPVTIGNPWYTLHNPQPATPKADQQRFLSQEATLRHLECEVNFEAELVLQSWAMGALIYCNYAGLPKLYLMKRMLDEAHCYVLERVGRGSVRLDSRLDLQSHSPTGIEWGYVGSGPAQLALDILADALDSDLLAVRLHQHFMYEWVVPWLESDEWMISQLQVVCWAEERVRPDILMEVPSG